MILNCEFLNDKFLFGVKELKNDLHLQFSSAGKIIKAEKGNILKVINAKEALIQYKHDADFFRGLRILSFMKENETYNENADFDNLGFQVDNSRNSVMNIDSTKELIRLLAICGYTQLYLYTEDTYEVNNEPYFGYFRGKMLKSEIKELDSYAKAFGIELIPSIQTLAHLICLFKQPEYLPLLDSLDVLLVENDRTYRLIENMISTVSECYSTRKINIGMDEAHHLGRGVYLDKHGYKDRTELFIAHLKKVAAICEKYGMQPMMWHDMFSSLLNDKEKAHLTDELPKNISVVYWDYCPTEENAYRENISKLKTLNRKLLFAGGLWNWLGFSPMNNTGLMRLRPAFNVCKQENIRDIIITSWGNDGGICPVYTSLPQIIFTAEYLRGHDSEKYIKAVFKQITGGEYDSFMALDIPNYVKNNAEPTGNYDCPGTYMLYNDYFLGIYDSTVEEGENEIYAKHYETLKQAKRFSGKYGYLFDTAIALTEILSYKYELGVRTRDAYKKCDKKTIEKLINDYYVPLVEKFGRFYEIYKKQWYTVNKPNGFEIITFRLAGMKQRTQDCAERLKAYCDGMLDGIPELEEKLLCFSGGVDAFKKNTLSRNYWNSHYVSFMG